ncbi:family 43 glycosylhydrolase [Paenibacillus sp. FSL H7-0331]|uniref:family 43 glycosylhydrolase n=2 Tax=Paenibacillus sp. FSL H7-0331 TaxID=1920421 RepID=UPI00096DA4BA|nr:oxidoreductase [Paenibacillus sp. FSL H7-0331]
MIRKRFRHLLLYLAVLLMLPQWSGAAAAAEPTPDTTDSISASTTGGSEVSNFYNTILQNGADPYAYKHTDGYYYYTHTTGGNVTLWRSKTLTGIDAGDKVVVWRAVPGTMYSSNVWAPEIHYLQDADGQYKWYIYFSPDNGEGKNHRMYVLENTNADPMSGEWKFIGKITDSTDRWAIDGTVLTVHDQQYFIWSGWASDQSGQGQNLYIAKMSDPKTISSERLQLSTPEYAWENTPGKINEGPQITIKGDTINLVYSANGSWTDYYCLGLITAKIGTDLMDLNSWTKRDKPIFSSANGVVGPGHHSLTTSPDGTEDWIVYHGARWDGAGWNRSIRTQKFTWNEDGTPSLGEPVEPNKPIAIPSGEPVRKRYEAEAALLVKDPSGRSGPAVRPEITASGGMKIVNISNTNDYAQFTVDVPGTGFYMLSVRNANGSLSGTAATQILSVNGSSGIKLNIIHSGWNRWGISTAKVLLKQGDNTVRFSADTNLAEIDSMDVFGLDTAPTILFESPGYTLGLDESRSLPVYTVTGTTYSPVESGVSFSSSNTAVVAIDGDMVKGVGAGSATITATYDGKTATTAVTVAAEPRSMQSIAISGLNNVLTSGQTGQLRVAASYNTYEARDVTAGVGTTYSSSNPDVAKVSVTGHVYDTEPGYTVIQATYGGKEARFNLMITPDPSLLPQILTPIKTPSGVTPRLPAAVEVIYKGVKGTATVNWKLDGMNFSSLGTVLVPAILTLNGEKIPTAVSVEVVLGSGLDEIVNQVKSRIDNSSYPLDKGLGSYSQAAYNALLAQLNHAEELSADANLTEEQLNQAQSALAQAEADLLGSFNGTQNGVFYNAYRDFSDDKTGKYPFGITIEALTKGSTATVQEENGNKFLRLATPATTEPKANLFLPFAGEAKAEADQRIVIEYRARLNAGTGYFNGAMVRNDSGTSNYSVVTAFDKGTILVQKGPTNKVPVQPASLNTWYKIKMVVNWGAKTYTVYIDDVEVATDYNFRHTGGTKLIGQVLGVDKFANASIDFDDFKVMVAGGAKVAPEKLGPINETGVNANDGRITGVNASMEWSADNGSAWSSVTGDTIPNLSPGTYWIRYRETDTHKASPHVELTIVAYK